MRQHRDRTGAEARLAAGARAFRGRIVTSSAVCLALLLAGGLTAAPVTTDSAAVRAPAHAAPSEAKQRLDLNRASLEEIQRLPLPPEVARAIWEHRVYVDYFGSIYDLMETPGMTPEILERLRPLVSTLPPESKDEVFRRLDASFRQVQQFLSEEGSREELADEYLDLLREPRNVNRMNLFDLQSFQNVSPVDAVAILKAREAAGRIENERQLRSSEGLSYWGFRNLRDYVIYEDPKTRDELHGDLQLVAFDTPYLLDEKDVLTYPIDPVNPKADFRRGTGWGIRGLDAANPAVLTKMRMRLGNDWKGGLLTFRQVGEEHLAETVKGFASWRNPELRGTRPDQESRTGLRGVLYGLFVPDRIVLGNYRLAFGQGLVMDNTDYFLPRKTGYGFNTRPRSILGDLSRSQEFALRGVALEQHYGPVSGAAFFSRDHKDGVLNPDGSINKYVVMSPRFENKELEAMRTEQGRFGLRRDAFLETVFGGNARAQLWKGTYIGVSGYQARYDKPWNPDINTLILGKNLGLLDTRDSELFRDYDSVDEAANQKWNFRRVIGAEFQTVYQNVALQGEYAKLDTNAGNGLGWVSEGAPEAYTVNAYVQYEDLNVQALWRDYDLGFDNPYARAFSNDSRYEQTLLGDPFRDQNPLLAWVALNTPQMKPERGLYVGLRYRVSRSFTISGLEFDNWTRVADGQDLQRYTFRCEYSPIFPLRFRLRQRVSSRSQLGVEDVRKFQGWDTRLEMQVRLTDYDELRLLYSTTKTEFAPRARLSEAATPGFRTALAQAGSPSQAVQAALMHNVNDRLLLGVSTELYDGFLYNFEDNEFVVVDDVGFRNWFLMRSRLSDSMLLRFKFTYDRPLTRNNIDLRSFENPYQFLYEGDDARAERTSFRLQLDYMY